MGQSLPVAVGVLLSPMPIVAMVLVLVSDRAKSNGSRSWSAGSSASWSPAR